jgi:probable F420-dependent oxidoreductase
MRWGLTIPMAGVPLAGHGEFLQAVAGFGYTDVWSSEVAGCDAFTPLALAAAWEPTLRLGTAIVPTFTRGPALIAMSAASLAEAAPGRFVLGLGASSPVIVHDWNGIPYEEPLRRTRDVLRAVRAALAGERVDATFDTFTVRRFKLEVVPRSPPQIMLAALRPHMLRLAGREADGAILNWLAASDVAPCVQAIGNPAAEVVARVFVCPSSDESYARTIGRRLISSYLTVPAYAAFHDWLGRGDALRPMHEAWAVGDRAAAGALIPDEVVDELLVHGSPEACRARVREYVEVGVQTPVLTVIPPREMANPAVRMDILRRLGPEVM